MTILKPLMIALAFTIISTPLHAERSLDLKNAQKLEIRDSMLGYRDTLLFYTFNEQKAVLVVKIGNKDETFPVVSTVYLFAQSVNEDGIKNWINNQHSDALYPDTAEPLSTIVLPEGICKVTSHKQTGTSENPGPNGGLVKDYEVKLTIKEYESQKKFKLSAFTDTVKVHVTNK